LKLLFLDRSTKLDSIHDLNTRARGGMVSSLFILTNLLSEMGHTVFVLADIGNPGETQSGARWFPVEQYRLFSSCDFLIFNRGTGGGLPEVKAKHRILWTHDLPHNGFIPDPNIMGAFSATVFMSKYAERVWRAFYRTIGKSYTIPNGVDKERFRPAICKDENYVIYASAPNRGLKRLPLIFEAVRNRTRPELHMTAFSNMAQMHPNEIGEDGDEYELTYKSVRESEVELRVPIPQADLAVELGRASLMILPTDYPEICSNIILQSLSCGTPVITTGGVGSAGEWITHGKNGMLTEFQPRDYMVYQMEMTRNAIEVLSDGKKHARMCTNAANTKTQSWDYIARKWDKMFRRLN